MELGRAIIQDAADMAWLTISADNKRIGLAGGIVPYPALERFLDASQNSCRGRHIVGMEPVIDSGFGVVRVGAGVAKSAPEVRVPVLEIVVKRQHPGGNLVGGADGGNTETAGLVKLHTVFLAVRI